MVDAKDDDDTRAWWLRKQQQQQLFIIFFSEDNECKCSPVSVDLAICLHIHLTDCDVMVSLKWVMSKQ